LGCGHGELDWEVVRPVMEEYLEPLPIEIYIHIHDAQLVTPEHKQIQKMKSWLRSEPHSLAFSEFWEDVLGLLKETYTFQLNDSPISFKVLHVDKPESGLSFEINDTKYFVSEDSMLDLWQTIRDMGFCLPWRVPVDVEPIVNYMISLISRIEYLTILEVRDSSNNSQLALSYKPPAVDLFTYFNRPKYGVTPL
jgi:hypothetical protein